MNTADINPFIRYAYNQILRPTHFFTCSYDCRLLYLQRGNMIFHYGYEKHYVKEGSFMLWNSGVPYMFETSEPTYIIILNFDFTQEHSYLEDSLCVVRDSEFDESKLISTPLFEDCPKLSKLLILSDMKHIENELTVIVREFRDKRLFYRETSSAILKKMLCDAARSTLFDDRGTVERVIAFIRENYSKKISNCEIAGSVNYHEYYVNKLMQNRTGMTLHQYLLDFRLQNAERLLMTTDNSVAKISEMSGFNSSAYFISAFKNRFGETPNEYRRRSGLI